MRTPMVTVYPRVKVKTDPKAKSPDNFYVEITVREKGIVIETWRTTEGKAHQTAREMREAFHGQTQQNLSP